MSFPSPQEPQTPISSPGKLDLSNCLGTDSLSDSWTQPGLVAQEDLSGVHGMRGHPLSQILSKTSGLGTAWHGWGPDPVHWGDTQGRGPSAPGFMWYQGMVFLFLSLPDPFLSARVDSVLETRSEVSVSPVGASTGAPCRFPETQVILCPQMAAVPRRDRVGPCGGVRDGARGV